ncbi:MAG: NBR1-Ig-like domain-containing protein [Anaerolineaceae bacterium]|nr:NBR1-Ig-like domain-containing protein [Anaerolineaceae bacterium]
MKKNQIIMMITLVVAILLALTACKPAGPATPSAMEIATRVAETQQAKATQMAVEQMALKLTELSKPTNTPEPTPTPMPTPVPPTPTVGTPAAAGTQSPAKPTAGTTNPSSNSSVRHWDKAGKCYFSFEFMGDVGGIQTDSTVKVNNRYDKQWKIKNNGTCAWSMDKNKGDHFLYLRPEAGYSLNYPAGVNLSEVPLCYGATEDIQPGDTCIVQVAFMALKEGKFYDYWNVTTPLGEFVGYGPNGNWSLGIAVSAAN